MSEPPPYRRPDMAFLDESKVTAALSRENWSGYSELIGVVPEGFRFFPVIKLWGSNQVLFLQSGDQFGDIVFVGAVCTNEDSVLPNSIIAMTADNFEAHYPLAALDVPRLDDGFGYDAPPLEHFSTIAAAEFLVLIATFNQTTLMPNLQSFRNSILRTVRLLKAQMLSEEGKGYVRELFGSESDLNKHASENYLDDDRDNGNDLEVDVPNIDSESPASAQPGMAATNSSDPPVKPNQARASGRLAIIKNAKKFPHLQANPNASATNQIPLGAINMNVQGTADLGTTSGGTSGTNKRDTSKAGNKSVSVATNKRAKNTEAQKEAGVGAVTTSKRSSAKVLGGQAAATTAKVPATAKRGQVVVQPVQKSQANPPNAQQVPPAAVATATAMIVPDRNHLRDHQVNDFDMFTYAANKYLDFHSRILE